MDVYYSANNAYGFADGHNGAESILGRPERVASCWPITDTPGRKRQMNRTTVAQALGWILVAAALGLFAAIPEAGGPMLALMWAVIVGVFRFSVAVLPDRSSRLAADGVFIVVCFLAAFEGGWYFIPAALAFAVADRATEEVGGSVRGSRQGELLFGVGAAAIGLGAIALVLWGPLYSSRSASIIGGNVFDGPTSQTNLMAVGVTPQAIAVLLSTAILLFVIAMTSIVDARTSNRAAHRLLGFAIVGIVAVAIAGAFTIGVFLLPSIALASLAWAFGHRADRGSGPAGPNASSGPGGSSAQP